MCSFRYICYLWWLVVCLLVYRSGCQFGLFGWSYLFYRVNIYVYVRIGGEIYFIDIRDSVVS